MYQEWFLRALRACARRLSGFCVRALVSAFIVFPFLALGDYLAERSGIESRSGKGDPPADFRARDVVIGGRKWNKAVGQ